MGILLLHLCHYKVRLSKISGQGEAKQVTDISIPRTVVAVVSIENASLIFMMSWIQRT